MSSPGEFESPQKKRACIGAGVLDTLANTSGVVSSTLTASSTGATALSRSSFHARSPGAKLVQKSNDEFAITKLETKKKKIQKLLSEKKKELDVCSDENFKVHLTQDMMQKDLKTNAIAIDTTQTHLKNLEDERSRLTTKFNKHGETVSKMDTQQAVLEGEVRDLEGSLEDIDTALRAEKHRANITDIAEGCEEAANRVNWRSGSRDTLRAKARHFIQLKVDEHVSAKPLESRATRPTVTITWTNKCLSQKLVWKSDLIALWDIMGNGDFQYNCACPRSLKGKNPHGLVGVADKRKWEIVSALCTALGEDYNVDDEEDDE